MAKLYDLLYELSLYVYLRIELILYELYNKNIITLQCIAFTSIYKFTIFIL